MEGRMNGGDESRIKESGRDGADGWDEGAAQGKETGPAARAASSGGGNCELSRVVSPDWREVTRVDSISLREQRETSEGEKQLTAWADRHTPGSRGRSTGGEGRGPQRYEACLLTFQGGERLVLVEGERREGRRRAGRSLLGILARGVVEGSGQTSLQGGQKRRELEREGDRRHGGEEEAAAGREGRARDGRGQGGYLADETPTRGWACSDQNAIQSGPALVVQIQTEGRRPVEGGQLQTEGMRAGKLGSTRVRGA